MALDAQLHETARMMIARYGREARAHAEYRADVLQQQGEPRSAMTWRLVMRAIAVLGEHGAAPAPAASPMPPRGGE